ncbi:MAG: DUF1634 domain-containing protein [Acidobacteriia bacterium]|nr:DUF1634 domain-containing protein [Terriglobia bacterium]
MQPWNDERVEQVISVLLRTGVLLSAVVVLAGGVCFLSQHANAPAGYHDFRAALDSYRSIRGVLRSAGSLDCRAIIQLGLLLLIATPVARVGFSLVAFWLERDRKYVALTLVVLAVLVFSLIGPH